MKRILIACVLWYRRWLSPLKRTPSCRFLPTCSEYAIEAIEVHGPWRGALYALARLLRCHPLCKGGFDPVKPRAATVKAAPGRISAGPMAQETARATAPTTAQATEGTTR